MNENKIIYDDYEITYANNDVEVKCLTTGKIYCNKFKTFKIIKQLQQENARLKDKIENATKLIEEIKLHYQQSPTMIPNVKINKLEDLLKEN